jgi:hypothetical protein
MKQRPGHRRGNQSRSPFDVGAAPAERISRPPTCDPWFRANSPTAQVRSLAHGSASDPDADPVGIGWNFGFIGATAMLTETYRPSEKAKAQGANDFLLFGSVAVASLMSGKTLNAYGWSAVNMVVFPVVLICLLSLAWLVVMERKNS